MFLNGLVVTPVPEPTAATAFVALGGLALLRRRRRTRLATSVEPRQ